MRVDEILTYIEKVTRRDHSEFIPLFIGKQLLGRVNRHWQQRLLSTESSLFASSAHGLICQLYGDYATVSRVLEEAALRWRSAGWLTGWRNEKLAVLRCDGLPLFELERAAFRPLGLTSRAVHVNGLCHFPDGEVGMWVGRRSADKAVDPNRMDNMVGGGIAAGESVSMALERESWEEAGIRPQLLTALAQRALIFAERPVARGMHCEWLYVFDLWLAPEIAPCNQDGEVAEHQLLRLSEVEALIIEERFIIDAALAAIDCLARLRYWSAEGDAVLRLLASHTRAVHHAGVVAHPTGIEPVTFSFGN